MKKNSVIVLVAFFTFISGCVQEIVSPPSQNNSGKIMLKIDQANAPESVVFVTATLTRENYDSLSSTMNILTDTTADYTFEEVAAGLWHLQVDAKDSVGQVLYTGSADVTVLAGILTQVSLVLNPTGVGTGGVYIYVTWGTPITYSWIDYHQNPVLSKSNVWWEELGVQQSKLIIENGQYKMWYHALSGGPFIVACYATSPDGINWIKSPSNPVLTPTPGSWDASAVNVGAVLKDNNNYKLYYFGWSNQYGNWHIGMAISVDGINWEKEPTPVLFAGSGWESQIAVTSVIKHNNMYYMYYTGINNTQPRIGLATSTDGFNWTRNSNNPILIQSESWEGTGISYASVIYDQNQFKMVYMNKNFSNHAFGMASSSDGISWVKSSTNPFFTDQMTANNWAVDDIAYPFLVKINNEYRIYYSGIGDNSIIYKLGYLKKQLN